MAFSPQQLVSELKTLSRGRGVHAPDIERHIGPMVRTACAIKESDGAEVIRERFSAWVDSLTHALPDDLRLVVTTSLGLNVQAQHPFLAHRMDWLAARTHRDARTVRRRIEDGFKRLAEAASRPHRKPKDDWYVVRIRVELFLDVTPPVRVEQWTVVALRDGVDEFVLPWATDVTVVRGAVQGECCLRFQEPLRAGETQEFWLQAPLSAPASYALRCDRFDLVVSDRSTSNVPSQRAGEPREQITLTA